MKKIYDYKKKAPMGVFAEMAIEFEDTNSGEKFAVTMADYLTHIEECEAYRRLDYVYVF